MKNLTDKDFEIIEEVCDYLKIPIGEGKRNTACLIVSEYKKRINSTRK